ncbi:MAG: hypothetical protein WDZ59_01095 [Pirellulales bacterium]
MPPFLEQFQLKYANPESEDAQIKAFAELVADTETGKCWVCHVKGKPKTERNRYGAALSTLLDKKNYTLARLRAEPEKVSAEIVGALELVAAWSSAPDAEESPTFGELLAKGTKPGGDGEPATSDAFLELADSAGSGGTPASASDQAATTETPEVPEVAQQAPVDPAAEQAAIAKLEEIGGTVRAVAQNDDSKDVDFHLSGTPLNDETLAAIKSVGKVVNLNLKDTQITDAGLTHLTDLKSLRRLHLERTKVGDAGLTHLTGLSNIEYLNLYGTEVTDAGLEHLTGLPNLRKVYLWQSQVTDEGVAKLQETLPNLTIVR